MLHVLPTLGMYETFIFGLNKVILRRLRNYTFIMKTYL